MFSVHRTSEVDVEKSFEVIGDKLPPDKENQRVLDLMACCSFVTSSNHIEINRLVAEKMDLAAENRKLQGGMEALIRSKELLDEECLQLQEDLGHKDNAIGFLKRELMKREEQLDDARIHRQSMDQALHHVAALSVELNETRHSLKKALLQVQSLSEELSVAKSEIEMHGKEKREMQQIIKEGKAEKQVILRELRALNDREMETCRLEQASRSDIARGIGTHESAFEQQQPNDSASPSLFSPGPVDNGFAIYEDCDDVLEDPPLLSDKNEDEETFEESCGDYKFCDDLSTSAENPQNHSLRPAPSTENKENVFKPSPSSNPPPMDTRRETCGENKSVDIINYLASDFSFFADDEIFPPIHAINPDLFQNACSVRITPLKGQNGVQQLDTPLTHSHNTSPSKTLFARPLF